MWIDGIFMGRNVSDALRQIPEHARPIQTLRLTARAFFRIIAASPGMQNFVETGGAMSNS
jgi:hypothetical protein